MHSLFKNTLVVGLIGMASALAMSFVGCKEAAKNGAADEGQLPLVVGLSADYPPFEYSNHGEFKGLDVDVIHALGKEMGREVIIEDIDFGGLIPALKTGRIDCIISAINPTPERLKQVSCTQPYYTPSGETIAAVFLKNAPLREVSDFTNKAIGIQMGSTFEILLHSEEKDLPGMTAISLARLGQLVQELKIGRIDGIVMDMSQAKAFCAQNPELSYAPVTFNQSPDYCIAVNKDNRLLLTQLNDALTKIRQNGELAVIIHSWFEGHSVDESAQ